MMTHSPEQQLLLRCAHLYEGVDSADQAHRLLREITDWDYLFRLASSHGIAPLLLHFLHRINWQLPEPYAGRLRTESRERARQNLHLTAELLKLLDLFENNSVPAVAFKGPALASLLYGGLASRDFCDLDILVHKQGVPRVKELMLAHGYRTDLPANRAQEEAYLRTRHELHFTPPDGTCLIEIHQAFLAPFYSLRLDYDSLWQRLERKPFCGREILTLAPDDLLLALCAHATKHSWARLAWICDVARLLTVKQHELDWPQILDCASALGASRMVLLGLSLAHGLLNAPVPLEVMEYIEVDAAVRRLAQRIIDSLFRENRTRHELQAHLFFLQTRERLRDKIAYCSRLALTPTEEDHSAFRLPALLSPLYYPLHAIRVFSKYGLMSLRSAR